MVNKLIVHNLLFHTNRLFQLYNAFHFQAKWTFLIFLLLPLGIVYNLMGNTPIKILFMRKKSRVIIIAMIIMLLLIILNNIASIHIPHFLRSNFFFSFFISAIFTCSQSTFLFRAEILAIFF